MTTAKVEMEGPASETNQAVFNSRKPDSETSEAGVFLESLIFTSETDEATQGVDESGKGEPKPKRYDDADDNHLDGVGARVLQPQPAKTIFNLLPEIWDGILPHLSATDFVALINSSSHWRSMFKSKIAGELLPLVLPVLINNLSYGVTPASLVCWRGVNRQSKVHIDQLLEEALSPQKYYEDLTTQLCEWSPSVMDAGYPLRSVVQKIRRCHTASNQQRQQEFVTRSTSSNSFLPILDLNAEFFNVEIVLQLLSQHAHHLTDLTLQLPEFPQDIFYLLLSHTPNLKALKLSGRMSMAPDMAEDYPVVQRLHHLTLLDIESLKLLNAELAPSILRICGPNLKRLICSIEFLSGGEQSCNVRVLTSETFPNLTCLRVAVASQTGYDWGFFSQPRTIRLEQLQLYFHPSPLDNYGGGEFCALRSLFRVNTFYSTLTHLQLSIRIGPWNENVRFAEFPPARFIRNFENLRTLSTWLPNVSQSWFWPFVCTKCPNLEELRLHEANWNEEEMSLEQLKRGFDLVPKLKRIVLFYGFHQLVTMPEKVVISRDVGKVQRVKFPVATHISDGEEDDE